MNRLLQLFARNGGFFTFLLVEVFCFYIVIRYNQGQKGIYAHTMGIVGGNLLDKQKGFSDYLHLRDIADSLRNENARLYAELANARTIQVPYRDTFFTVQIDTLLRKDSSSLKRLLRPQYRFIAARVIGNSVGSANNWMVINRGSSDGLRPNMGVVTGKGVAGIVRHVGNNFSMVMSVLHRDARISVSLKKEKALGSLIWEGAEPYLMTLKFIPRHFEVQVGDGVVTSGYSELFPKGIPVGTIYDIKPDPENQYFWIMKVRLSQDMATLSDVYAVDNIYYSELDSLKQNIKDEQ